MLLTLKDTAVKLATKTNVKPIKGATVVRNQIMFAYEKQGVL
jgi:hypothetical protein